MRLIRLISTLLFIFAISLTGGAQSNLAEENQPPNIIFFFCDDLGYADIGVYGHPYAKTPALDKLASEGTRFEQHYVTGVTCNPSRTGLMTGLFPARYDKYASFHGFGDRVSITELLNKRGYKTGHFGKWHIGPKDTEVDGMYGLDKVEVTGKSKDKSAGRDDDLTTAAIAFIKENAHKQPLYVNVWGHSTHFPVTASPKLASRFIELKVKRSDFSQTMQKKFDECLQIGGDLDESMRQYLGDVYSVDRNVHRLLQTIDELGMRDNTIFVFSSDHGPAPVILGKKGHREFSNNMLGYAGIFRGGKHNQLEGGGPDAFPQVASIRKASPHSSIGCRLWLPSLALTNCLNNSTARTSAISGLANAANARIRSSGKPVRPEACLRFATASGSITCPAAGTPSSTISAPIPPKVSI
jgi:arylsulfatase A-like enzyme